MNQSIFDYAWADASLEELKIILDDIYITISGVYDVGRVCVTKTILGRDLLSIKYIGSWDENIISTFELLTDSSFIQETLNTIKENKQITLRLRDWEKQRFDEPWLQLNITLVDGLIISMVCKTFEVV
jgi:hypothetical protein